MDPADRERLSCVAERLPAVADLVETGMRARETEEAALSERIAARVEAEAGGALEAGWAEARAADSRKLQALKTLEEEGEGLLLEDLKARVERLLASTQRREAKMDDEDEAAEARMAVGQTAIDSISAFVDELAAKEESLATMPNGLLRASASLCLICERQKQIQLNVRLGKEALADINWRQRVNENRKEEARLDVACSRLLIDRLTEVQEKAGREVEAINGALKRLRGEGSPGDGTETGGGKKRRIGG
jgi:hypothetical protein